MYKAQNTEIDVNGCKEEARIRRGVRQGCFLLPYLFCVFIEAVADMKRKTRGMKINAVKVH